MLLTHNALVEQLRPLIHPMLVHFPIALLFVSVALDWIGYWLKHPNLTRSGFYTLVLGAFAAGIAALSGPDHATGDPSVPGLLAAHQTWASVTVALAVAMVAARFVATRGLSGGWVLVYLAGTVALLGAVCLTGYYGGEMTYHHAVGVTINNAPAAAFASNAAYVSPLIPAKPFVALLGMLSILAFGAWMVLGSRLFPIYYPKWWRAVRQDLASTGGQLWTLRRGSAMPARSPDGEQSIPRPQMWTPPGQPGQPRYPWADGPRAANVPGDDSLRAPSSRR